MSGLCLHSVGLFSFSATEFSFFMPISWYLCFACIQTLHDVTMLCELSVLYFLKQVISKWNTLCVWLWARFDTACYRIYFLLLLGSKEIAGFYRCILNKILCCPSKNKDPLLPLSTSKWKWNTPELELMLHAMNWPVCLQYSLYGLPSHQIVPAPEYPKIELCSLVLWILKMAKRQKIKQEEMQI